jgi:hypothetical protein
MQAAYQWLQNEKDRLEKYTHAQLDILHRKHQEEVQRHYRHEESLVLRAQEVNRELQFLASQSQAMQQRAGELAQWESSLAAQMDKVHRAQEEFLKIQQTSDNLQKDTEAQQRCLEALRAETAQLQVSRTTAHAEFAKLETTLTEHHQLWQTKQAEITARQIEMEERYRRLEEMEAAARRRLAEVDDLEERLRQEFETQQTQLARDRRDLEMLYEKLRRQQPSRTADPMSSFVS